MGTPKHTTAGSMSDECQLIDTQLGPASTYVNITFHCAPVEIHNLSATVTASIATTGQSLEWHLNATVLPPWGLQSSQFPRFTLTTGAWQPPAGLEAGPDRVVLCGGDGALLIDPTRYGWLTDFDFPGSCGLQMMARYDNASGLYMAAHDTTASVKHFAAGSMDSRLQPREQQQILQALHSRAVPSAPPSTTSTFKRRAARPGTVLPPAAFRSFAETAISTALSHDAAHHSLLMTTYHIYPEVPGAPFNMPYSVVTQGFRGDWRTAAGLYRIWARQQAWATEGGSLTNASRVPAWLVQGAALLMLQVQNSSGFMPDVAGPTLTGLASMAASYQQLLGVAHMALLPMGWERDGAWAGIEYFPAVPSDAAWAAAAQAMAVDGNKLGAMVSGFWWVLRRAATMWGPAFDNSAALHNLTAALDILADGVTPWTEDAYNQTMSGDVWRGLSYRLCHGSAQARSLLAAVFARLATQLGMALVSFDQEIGGGQSTPCYAASHDGDRPSHMHTYPDSSNHPPGAGPWMAAGFADTVARVRAACPSGSQAPALCQEQTGELSIPLLSTMHTYESAVNGWPWPGVAGTGLPLFSTVYHPLLPAIGLPAGQEGNDNVPDTVRLVRQSFANALVTGLLLETGTYFVALPTTPAPTPLQSGLTAAFAASTAAHATFASLLLPGELVAGPTVLGQRGQPSTAFPDAATQPCSGDAQQQAGTGHFMGALPQDASYIFPLCSVTAGAFVVATPLAAGPALVASLQAVGIVGGPAALVVVASISDEDELYSLRLDTWAPEPLWTFTNTTLLSGAGKVLRTWSNVPVGPLNATLPSLGVHVWLLSAKTNASGS